MLTLWSLCGRHLLAKARVKGRLGISEYIHTSGNYVIRGIKTTTFLHINLSLLKFPLVHSKAVPENRLRMCIIK